MKEHMIDRIIVDFNVHSDQLRPIIEKHRTKHFKCKNLPSVIERLSDYRLLPGNILMFNFFMSDDATYAMRAARTVADALKYIETLELLISNHGMQTEFSEVPLCYVKPFLRTPDY